MPRRRINGRGLALVKHFESCFLRAYKCPAGVWTIGWGHTGLKHRDGTVYPGRVITQAKADDLLAYDMGVFERDVESLIKVPVNDDQFAALVSFAFNVGSDIDVDKIAEGLGDSTLLTRLNAGDFVRAADEFLKWNKSGGRVLRGLTRRRVSERRLFLGYRDFIVRA